MKPIIINTYTLLFPHRKIDLYRDRWTNELRTYRTRAQAQSECEAFEMYDQTKGRWPKVARCKVTVSDL